MANPKSKAESSKQTKLIQNPKSFRSRLVAWFKKNGRDLPWRRGRNPYAVLVSEMMLQQTQVATVIGYFERWMRRFPDFSALAAASGEDVLHAWQGLGYYTRARNLHRAAQVVVERHAGKMPGKPDAIRALPGIGPYTAGAVAAFAFDRPVPVVDANIARVLARLFDIRKQIDTAPGRKEILEIAAALQPEKGAGDFNEALMELGALVCLPRKPKCAGCPVRPFCMADNPEELPLKKARRKTVALEENCAWIFKNGRVLLEQQTGPRWNGLWKLPQIRKPGRGIRNQEALLRLDYPFTHHRVELAVFLQSAPKMPAKNQAWFPVEKLESAAMTAPHRRALRRLLAEVRPA